MEPPQRILNPPMNPIPSSSPAFGTPVHPINPRRTNGLPPPNFGQPVNAQRATILPILLTPNLLRPVAFRTFTKKHNLTLSSSALASLAAFIGKHCGAGWREDGLAEGVLEEAAKLWRKEGGETIVKAETPLFKTIIKILEGCMHLGKVVPGKSGISRQGSFAFTAENGLQMGLPAMPRLESQGSFGVSALSVTATDEDEEKELVKDPREWIKVIGAFEQPKLIFNPQKKHFDKSMRKPSLFPPPTQKTDFFRQKYHIIHQRVLRHDSFQAPSFPGARVNTAGGGQGNKITPIANLLGRSGSSHLLLGLLSISPTGTLAISDLTGSIGLDLQHAQPFPDRDSAVFAPGMIVLIEGMYQEDYSQTAESALGNTGGIGGTIGGKFFASLVAHPPCERRATSLGLQESSGDATSSTAAGPAFGWTDFLGVGAERATGSRMRRLEQRVLGPGAPHAGNGKILIAADVRFDQPSTLSALRTMLSTYNSLPPSQYPMSIVLMGNFLSQPALSGAHDAGTLEYKEAFDSLASILSEFPQLIARTTLVFIPGDNDAWGSAFSAGAAMPLPRHAVPELFTNRIRRTVAEANREIGAGGQAGTRKEGEVIWTSNPSRFTWFGSCGEMMLFRDDLSGRLRRTALDFGSRDGTVEDGDPDNMTDTQINAPPPTAGETQDTQPMDIDAEADSNLPSTTTKSSISSGTKQARRLTRTIIDQGFLSPFPLDKRPVHWDYGHALSLFPLPSALVLADPDAPAFSLNYHGCCVMNPGRIVEGRKGERCRWVEFDVLTRKGVMKGENVT